MNKPPNMIKTSKEIGQIGEDAATRFLRRRLYRILCRNYIDGKYEIDIIAECRRAIVFLEVKARTGDRAVYERYGLPSDAVDAKKRAFIISAARTYLARHKIEKPPRFDVIEIYFSPDKSGNILKIRHMKDAYRAY